MSCKVVENIYDFQTFPSQGKLSENIDLSLSNLLKHIDKNENENSTVFAYTIDTVTYNGIELQQTGCAPNFQGNFITLCNCKHMMRARNEKKEFWENNWIAGICSKKGKCNALFYLMKISDALVSHYDMWNYLPLNTRKFKSTHGNIYGDVFEPKRKLSLEEQYSRKNYKDVCKNHRHNRVSDIKYDIEQKFWGRYPYLLIGYPENSFIWKTPLIVSEYRKRTKFRQKDFKFGKFIEQLSSF